MTPQATDDEILMELSASGPRRVFACAVLGMLGLLLLYLAVLVSPSFLWSMIFFSLGLAILYMSWWQYQVTAERIVLTRAALFTTDGALLADVANIKSVERGALAFKPSQGFLIRTLTPSPRAWAPGLYWRLGRTMGIGGVTNAGQGKAMAEMLQALVAERG